jgi:hypothetical protein
MYSGSPSSSQITMSVQVNQGAATPRRLGSSYHLNNRRGSDYLRGSNNPASVYTQPFSNMIKRIAHHFHRYQTQFYRHYVHHAPPIHRPRSPHYNLPLLPPPCHPFRSHFLLHCASQHRFLPTNTSGMGPQPSMQIRTGISTTWYI